MKRRIFLQAALTTAQIGWAVGAGLLSPGPVLAQWPVDAFHATTLDEALRHLLAGAEAEPSDRITIEAHDLAEDGRTVPIGVRSAIEGTRTISILSERNPNPAIATFEMTPHIDATVNTRIKMAESGFVIAVVAAGGKYYSARKPIQVTSGGCA